MRVMQWQWVCLGFLLPAANAGWPETINLAGMQRTLSQMMTKEFLLISRGTKVEEYKVKLQESMSNFNSTLYALMTGDAARDIIPAPNSQVETALQEVLTEWLPMEALLRNNMDTVRRSDGTLDMVVLEELNSRNVPLLDTSNAVVGALVDAAQVSGATTNGLVQDIAGRQRTLIQRLAKGILLLSQGVAMTFNMQAYRDTKSLFEESHNGIIQGVPFAGLPVLSSVCTLHQMREVSFYYQKLRPLLTGITNADTPSLSQKAADEVAEEVVELIDPLYFAMVEAVKIFGKEDTCNPSNGTTHDEWRSYFSTLADQRLLTQQSAQYFTQVGLKVDVKTSQVEITVMLSQASQTLRDLIEGNKVEGIPAPPSQEVVDKLLDVAAIWKTFESELESAVHMETVSSIILARVELLARQILGILEDVNHLAMDMVENSTVPAFVIDLSTQQALLTSQITQAALHVLHGKDVSWNWDELNASRSQIESARWQLLQGVPGTLEKVTDVCIIQEVKSAMDLFSRLERAALRVANGEAAAVNELITLNPQTVRAFDATTMSLANGNGSCANGTLQPDEWRQLHQEASIIAALSREVAAEFVLFVQGHSHNNEKLETLEAQIHTELRRIMFGSFDPPVAAPPTQSKFDIMLNDVEPATRKVKEALVGNDIQATLKSSLDLTTAAQRLQEEYFVGALAADPRWPGARVDLAFRQVALARQVFQEAVLYAYDLSTSDGPLQEAIQRFELAHNQLKDGGDDFAEIMMPERQDLMDQWDIVSTAWQQVKGYQSNGFQVSDLTRMENSVNSLVLEMQTLLQLLAIEDVKSEDAFPWSAVVYSIIGFIICSCCCVMICVPWLRKHNKRQAEAAAKAAERSAMTSMSADGV